MRTLRLVIVSLLTVAFAGCATSRLQAPQLTIVGASMISADVFSQQFRVRVHVHNPNDRTLPIKAIQYNLFLEGDSFADGESAAPFVVPANGEQEFDLAVHTHFVSSIGRLMSRLTGTDRNAVQYNFEGSIIVDMPFSPKIKFNQVGMVDLNLK